MAFQVFLQEVISGEIFLAYITFKRLLPGVGAHVRDQTTLTHPGLVARLALKVLLPLVKLCVMVQGT